MFVNTVTRNNCMYPYGATNHQSAHCENENESSPSTMSTSGKAIPHDSTLITTGRSRLAGRVRGDSRAEQWVDVSV